MKTFDETNKGQKGAESRERGTQAGQGSYYDHSQPGPGAVAPGWKTSEAQGTDPRANTRRHLRRSFAALGAIAALALPLVAGEVSAANRTIQYRDDWPIPRIYTRIGFSTEVILPKPENVIKVLVSNNYFGSDSTGNKIDLKAMGDEPGHVADVRIYTASGNEYSLILEEVSKKQVSADLRIIVMPEDAAAIAAMNGKPKFYTADQVEALQAQIAAERAKVKQAEDDARAREQKAEHTALLAATKEVSRLVHDYEIYGRKGEDFHPVIYRDDKFTYIELNSQETPALYEIKDGKLSQVEKQFVNGKYTVPKIIDNGVLKVGKSQVKFRRNADS